MATYEYRCDVDGVFDVTRPLGTASASVTCGACGKESRRVYSMPFLPSPARDIMNAIDRSEKSRDEPEVVRSLPSTGARRRTTMAKMTPALQRLPRP